MADAPEEPAELEMSNAHEKPLPLGKNNTLEETAISAPDTQPAESSMAATPYEEIDSRTLIAGRKRNLQEFSLNQEPSGAHEVSDEQRSRKRLKDCQQLPPTEEGLAANITSPLRVPSPDKFRAGTSHQPPSADEPTVSQVVREETAASQASGAQSQSLFDHVDKDLASSLIQTGATQPATIQSQPTTQPTMAPQTWNAGVQGGLRISFGNRARLVSKSTVVDALEGNVPRSVETTGSGPSARAFGALPHSSNAAPFQQLSREEEANLSGEEKGRYLKSLFAHLKETTSTESATPSADRGELNVNMSANNQLMPWQDISGSFKELKACDLAKLNLDQKEQYRRARRYENRHGESGKRKRKEKRKERKKLAAKTAAALLLAPSFQQSADLMTVDAELGVTSPDDHDVSSDEDEDEDQAGGEVEDDEDEDEDSAMDTDLLQDGTQSTKSHTPSHPFEILKNRELLRLTSDQRAEYGHAYTDHLSKEQEEMKNRKKENRQVAQAAKAEAQVNPSIVSQSSASFEGPKDAKKQNKFTTTTQMAERAIARRFPLLEADQYIKQQMSKGKTFYARQPKTVAEYSNKHGKWVLSEIFGADGKPLTIHQIQFNTFAPSFLASHHQGWESINLKTLIRAFVKYITVFYSHLGDAAFGSIFEDCRATATAPDALTIEDAKVIANQLLNQHVLLKYEPTDMLGTSTAGEAGHLIADGQAVTNPLSAALLDTNEPLFNKDVAINDIEDDGALAEVDIEVQEAELFLQQRYFPSTDLTVQRCLACSKTGHNNSNCPYMTCTHCGTSGVHSDVTCPKQKRCQKCRERGHRSTECPEKLSLPRSEMTCDLCGSSEHLENGCHCVWRSFDPKPEEIFTVRDIPVNCYTCGSGDHFGPECGLHRGPLLTGGFTWSKDNLLKYVDHSSQSRALSAGIDYSIPKKVPKAGNANDPITINDESDSEEEAFLRPTVPRPVNSNHGKIQVQKQPAQRSHEFHQPLPQRGGKPNPKNQPKKQKNQQSGQPGLSKQPKKPKQKGMQNQKPHVQKQPDPNYTRNPNPPRESRPNFFHRNPEMWHPAPGTAPPTGPSNRGGQNNQNNVGTGNAGVKRPKKSRQQRQRAKAATAAGNISGGAGGGL